MTDADPPGEPPHVPFRPSEASDQPKIGRWLRFRLEELRREIVADKIRRGVLAEDPWKAKP